jgi:hypothetical protein
LFTAFNFEKMSHLAKLELRPLKGIDIPPTTIMVEVKGEILIYEAPLIEHVVNDRGEDFLLKWSDTDQEVDRWMLYRTPPSSLLDFFNKKVNLRDLINNNPDGFVLFLEYEIQGGGQPVRVTKTNTGEIPPGYLPFEDSYYDKGGFMYYEYCEQLRQQLEARLTSNQLYKIRPEPSPTVLNEPPTE